MTQPYYTAQQSRERAEALIRDDVERVFNRIMAGVTEQAAKGHFTETSTSYDKLDVMQKVAARIAAMGYNVELLDHSGPCGHAQNYVASYKLKIIW